MLYKHFLSALICITALIFIAPPALATELNVPSQYATIQAAINAAATSGDTIIVQPGTYNEDISFGGKDIILTSTDPDTESTVEATIIHGTGTTNVVTFDGTETADCELTGFTITGGNALVGGGILGYYSNATISNCIIKDNHVTQKGGGLYRFNGDINNSIIHNNSSDLYGGALAECNSNMISCVISDNYSEWAGAMYYCNGNLTNCLLASNSDTVIAGAIYSCEGNITNCTIVNNHSTSSSAALNDCKGNITNCILWNNTPDDLWDSSSPTYSCWSDGTSGTGNISSDPCFVTGLFGYYYLSQIAAGQAVDSPCIDAGSDTAANLGLDNQTTRTDSITDIGIVDMGFHYELYDVRDDADINGDNDINLEDFAILAAQWLDTPGTPSADIAPPGGDNIVDILDLNILTNYWLQ